MYNRIRFNIRFVHSIYLVFILNNLTLDILSIVFLLGFRCVIGELVLTKIMNILIYKDIILETVLTAIFIISSWFINNMFCSIIYTCFYLIYVFIKRKDIKRTILLFKKILRK
mgnify:CR=1 FL=1